MNLLTFWWTLRSRWSRWKSAINKRCVSALKWIFIHVDYLPFTMQRNIYLLSILAANVLVLARKNKEGCTVWMCRWQGSVALLQTESDGFTFLYVRMENWVHLMLQNEYQRNWTFRRSIHNVEFQTNKKPEAEKSRRKIYLSDSRKAGKFICLLRPSNGWLHLKVDWSGRIKVNIKGLPKTIIGIICIRNCPLPSETVMLRRVGIKILGRRIRIKLSLFSTVSAFQPHASTRKSP